MAFENPDDDRLRALLQHVQTIAVVGFSPKKERASHGVALAMQCGVPDAVCHIIATHAGEGDMVKRSTEAYIVHHADFMSFLPFKNLAL